ncbi:CHAD domain-containing protein [Streptomyces sp. WMMC897]|uniref:CHAD domain-containing protein n=1 Tax=Streptomyces sp. WMMC897 TaxID=3014782 RepID=UPI0022B61C93|nr:CHAD domain-containing protein [Streptomyces sp. WMMC897]MCZ7415011.1 CHAD domain-containing protein [Streptomyces sp. WMMC897]
MAPRHDLTADGSRPSAAAAPRTRVPRAAGAGSARLGTGGTGGDKAPPAPVAGTAGELLSGYLHHQAAELLRALRMHEETAGSPEAVTETAHAVRLLRRAARRISATLHTFRRLLDPAWADELSAELNWLSELLTREYDYANRLERLLSALHRLSSAPEESDGAGAAGRPGVGAARAGALLERQLTLLRTRAHSAALQALGSGRFHAVADAVAVLASEVPLAGDALTGAAGHRPAHAALRPSAEHAHRRLVDAVDSLPFGSGALAHTLTAAEDRYDGSWHQVGLLLRFVRYAQEVLGEESPPLSTAARHLRRHREAADAAGAAATAGRTPRIAPATAYALGVLHADQRHEVEAARLAFCRVWHPAGGADHAPVHA